nr:AIPR family protein [Aridibaculum aurantiacum]
MENVSDKVDEYLAILPALILADIYGQYKQGLLEKNVRTFLQFKAKVNNGIRETIRTQPDMFFAYNNGISTTAEKVDVIYEEGIPYLNRIENLQIVNGGQTTASIYYTSGEKGIDLSRAFVPMKISVVKPGNSLNDVVPSISRFANSQTAIKDSDFSSNSQYHVSLEQWSRSEWVPETGGGKAISKWYYERTRGQYLDERSRIPSKKDQKRFDVEYPKKQKFNKTDLAKYEMSWRQRPHDASKGGEKNFLLFVKDTDHNVEISKTQYHHVIAKAILFHEIDKMITAKKLGGYKANVVSYTIAILSFKTGQKLDLETIWQQQELNDDLRAIINRLIDVVWEHIMSPSKSGMNITEWCKRQECWLTLRDKHFDTGMLKNHLVLYGGNGMQAEALTEQEIKMIEEASTVKAETWFALAKWAKENNLFSPFDRKLSYNLGIIESRGKGMSVKQAKNGIRILQLSKKEGFEE